MRQKEKCIRRYIQKGKEKKEIPKQNGICKYGGLCKTVIYLCSVEGQQDNLDTNITKLNLTHDNMQICNPGHSKFLGLMINSRLSWQTHIDQIVPKLNTAAYAIRSLKQVVNLETLKIAYFAFAHSILSYGIIFWGISKHSNMQFKIQKRMIRIIMNVDSRTSC